MTILQHLSHKEQMEAVRIDFDRLWQVKLLPLLHECHFSERDLSASKHAAWLGFLCGRMKDHPYNK